MYAYMLVHMYVILNCLLQFYLFMLQKYYY